MERGKASSPPGGSSERFADRAVDFASMPLSTIGSSVT